MDALQRCLAGLTPYASLSSKKDSAELLAVLALYEPKSLFRFGELAKAVV